MVTRVIIFLIILTSSALANCKNYYNFSEEMIQNIVIKVDKERKFIIRLNKYFTSHLKNLHANGFNKKKKFTAKITVNYIGGNYCTYKAKLRMHGDNIDHVSRINGETTTSLRVQLTEGNIKNITRFILFKPNSRNYENEIFAATLLKHLGFLSPRTFKVKVKVFNAESEYIFQEDLKKEFLENNNRVEGPILESKEEDNNYLKMSRVSNKEWIKENKNKYIVSLNAIQDYNLILLKSYQFRFLGGGDEFIRFDPKDFNKNAFKKISIFDAIMFGINGFHGLSYNDRRFYYDPIYSELEPIYYDGDVTILSKIRYNKLSDEFKKYSRLAKYIHFDFYSNHTRSYWERYSRATVTNSAKKGASLAILILEKLNKEILLKDLHANGFNNISIQQLNFLIDHIIERLELIGEAKVYRGKIILEKSLYSHYENEMGLKNDLNLFFTNSTSSISNKNSIPIEECNYLLESCVSYLADNKKLIKLIDQKKIDSTKSVFINFDKKDYELGKIQKSKNNIKNNFHSLKINESFEISFNKEVEISLDKKNRIINLNYLNDKGRAIIFDSKIDSWSIRMYNLSKVPKNEFDNTYNLTGCLTIIDSQLNKVNIMGENFNCEDTLNFIRSSGTLNNIQIKNSRSDSLDADFSQLKFNFVFIEKSQDDCIDFSYGIYEVKNANLNDCGDKAVSVGEKSKAIFDIIDIENSYIGIAAKDSSKVYISKAQIKNSKVCLSAYKKKQEFNGSYLEVNNLRCEVFDEKSLQDNKSTLVVKNEF